MSQAVLIIGLQAQAVLSSRLGSDMTYMTLGRPLRLSVFQFCICKMEKGESCSYPGELGG